MEVFPCSGGLFQLYFWDAGAVPLFVHGRNERLNLSAVEGRASAIDGVDENIQKLFPLIFIRLFIPCVTDLYRTYTPKVYHRLSPIIPKIATSQRTQHFQIIIFGASSIYLKLPFCATYLKMRFLLQTWMSPRLNECFASQNGPSAMIERGSSTVRSDRKTFCKKPTQSASLRFVVFSVRFLL